LNLLRRVIIKAGEKVVGLELLSAFSGVLIAAQSRVNGALSDEMGDSLEAAIVSFSTGLLFVTLIAVFRKDVRAGFRQIFKATKAGKMPPGHLPLEYLVHPLLQCKPMWFQLQVLLYLLLHPLLVKLPSHFG
jgi:hypothetical protein